MGNVSIETNDHKRLSFESEVLTGSTVTGYIENGSEYKWDNVGNDWALDRSWTYEFDTDHNLKSGTQQEGNQTVTYGPNWVITSSTYSGTSELQQLNELFKAGVLTQEEFDKAKKKLLN